MSFILESIEPVTTVQTAAVPPEIVSLIDAIVNAGGIGQAASITLPLHDAYAGVTETNAKGKTVDVKPLRVFKANVQRAARDAGFTAYVSAVFDADAHAARVKVRLGERQAPKRKGADDASDAE